MLKVRRLIQAGRCTFPSTVHSSLRTVHSAAAEPLLTLAKEELLRVKLPVLYDNLHYQRGLLLRKTIDSFLPNFQTVPSYGKRTDHPLHPGQHLIFFPQPVDTSALLPDGTDTVHYPGEPWTHRLWAGGRVQFPQTNDLLLDGRMKIMVELIRDVRVTGAKDAERIFVKIERRLGHYEPGRSEERRRAQISRSSEDDLSHALLVETRDLCFMRSPPTGAPVFSTRQVMVPSTPPDYSHNLIPTPTLLFRFSALTFNAHAIHIDPEYTRNVYGLPGLLVHGPLSLLLLLEYMRRVLESEAAKRGILFEGVNPEKPAFVVTEINYRNLAPLFVNQEMTLCCAKKDDASGQSGRAEKWDVWIQTGHDERASLAVRGTITVEPRVDSQ